MRRAETPTTFVDLLDPARVLVLAPNKEDTADVVTARVFWTGPGKDGKPGRIFGGTTTIPRNLLFVGDSGARDRRPARFDRRNGGAEDQRERIGYMAEGAYQRKLEREARDARHSNRDDFDE